MAFITAFLLFILPLIVFPFFTFAFETPKALIAQLGIEGLLIISLVSSKGIKLKKISPKLLVLCITFFAISLIHLLLYPEQTSLFGNIFRLQGIFLLWHLLLFTLLSSQVNLSKVSRNIYLVSFLGIFLSSFLMGENRAGRAVGTLGEPNALAATAVIIFPFLFFYFKNIWVRIFSIVLVLTVVLLARSTSGLLALSLQTIFIQLMQFRKLELHKTYLLILVIIGLSLLLPFTNLNKQLEVNPATSPFRFESREEIWRTAFASGFNSPIIGSGFGSIQRSLNDTSQKLGNNIQYQIVDSSHNFLLDYWVQGGLVGLLSLVLLIAFAIKGLILNSKILELTVFIGVLVAMLFNPVSVVTLLFFWWLIGQGFLKEDV